MEERIREPVRYRLADKLYKNIVEYYSIINEISEERQWDSLAHERIADYYDIHYLIHHLYRNDEEIRILSNKMEELSGRIQESSSNRICPFLNNDSNRNNDMHLMVGLDSDNVARGSRRAKEELRQFTKNKERLIIIDPYFFSIPFYKDGHKHENKIKYRKKYIDTISKTVNIQTVKSITVVHSKYHKKDKKTILDRLSEYSNKFECIESEDFHDRIWIGYTKSCAKAKLVGSSLNGIGNKFSFIIDLPDKDLKELESVMNSEGIIPNKE